MEQSNRFPVQWRSFYTYILVTTGAVVGLGNVFQFPFLVIKFGGAFLFFYVLFEVLISIPLLFAELLIGRRGKLNPVSSIGLLAIESNASPFWYKAGWFCVLVAFLTLSYYAVSAAFPIGYFADSINSMLNHGIKNSPALIKTDTDLLEQFPYLECGFIIFLFLTFSVIWRGINRGLETLSMIVVPAYFFILLSLAIYTCFHGDFIRAIDGLFALHSDQSYLVVIFAALSYAFFKLGVGMGTMIVYGSYLPYHVPLVKSTLIVIAIDAVISLLSYFIVFPLLLESNFEDVITQNNVITIFSNIPYGVVIASIFFFTCILAAWTPTIAMAETIVVTVMKRFEWSRPKSTLVIATSILILGTIVVLMQTSWSELKMYAIYQDIIGGFLAPLSALLITIFAGWVLRREVTRSELEFSPAIYAIWRFLLRYVAPVVIVVILIASVVSINQSKAIKYNVATTTMKSIEVSTQSLADQLVKIDRFETIKITALLSTYLENNPQVYGASFSLAPMQKNGQLTKSAPYVYRDGAKLSSINLADSYDYPTQSWYAIPVNLKKPVWSKPYFDQGGGNTWMITYSIPVYSDQNKSQLIGVVTSDVQIEKIEN